MVRDVDLILAAKAAPLTTSSSTTAIECEGGMFAIVRFFGGTIADSDETFDVDIEASVDDEETFGQIGSLPQIVATDDDIEIARVVYIPRPREVAAGTKVNLTHVRLTWVAAGVTPSWPVTVYIEPLVSLGAPAVDEDLETGVAALKAS